MKGVIQLLLVIGGVFGMFWSIIIACSQGQLRLFGLEFTLSRAALLALAGFCLIASMLGALWIRYVRKIEVRDPSQTLSAVSVLRKMTAGPERAARFSAFELKPGMQFRVIAPFTYLTGRFIPLARVSTTKAGIIFLTMQGCAKT